MTLHVEILCLKGNRRGQLCLLDTGHDVDHDAKLTCHPTCVSRWSEAEAVDRETADAAFTALGGVRAKKIASALRTIERILGREKP